jgi:uncharacterized GH25 family protein
MRLSSVLLLCGALAAFGHGMYVMPSSFFPAKGAALSIGFHIGDSFPESELSSRVERYQNPRLLWKGGSAPLTNLRVDGKRNVADAPAALGAGELIAAVSTSTTVLELEPAKFAEYLKEEGLPQVKPGKERYSKYAKAILLSGAANGFARQAVGFVIEIIPEADPYTLKPGASLPVQVLFRGKPAADLQIESSWADGKSGAKTVVVGRTGADGRLKVPLTAAGRWRIHTIKMEKCAEPAAADWESFWASLTFEIR